MAQLKIYLNVKNLTIKTCKIGIEENQQDGWWYATLY